MVKNGVKREKTALNGNGETAKFEQMLSVADITENSNQLTPLRYLSNQATVRRMESIWFSRFSKP